MNLFSVSQALQKRLLKFLLKRALGPFLLHELDLEQLDVQLGQGKLVLDSLDLRSDAFNAMLPQPSPFHILRGSVNKITFHVPLMNLLSGECTVEIEGMSLSMQLVDGSADITEQCLEETIRNSIIFRSELLNSSLCAQDPADLANEFVQEEHVVGDGDEAVSILASFVDKMLSRIAVNVRDIAINVNFSRGNRVEIRIPCVQIKDASETESDLLCKTCYIEKSHIFYKSSDSEETRHVGFIDFPQNDPCLVVKLKKSEKMRSISVKSIEFSSQDSRIYLTSSLVQIIQLFMRSLGEAMDLSNDFLESHHELEVYQSVYFDALPGNSFDLPFDFTVSFKELQLFLLLNPKQESEIWGVDELFKLDHFVLACQNIAIRSQNDFIEFSVDHISFAECFKETIGQIIDFDGSSRQIFGILKNDHFQHSLELETVPLELYLDVGKLSRLLEWFANIQQLEANDKKLPFNVRLAVPTIRICMKIDDKKMTLDIHGISLYVNNTLISRRVNLDFNSASVILETPTERHEGFLTISSGSIVWSDDKINKLEYERVQDVLDCQTFEYLDDLNSYQTSMKAKTGSWIEIQVSKAHVALKKAAVDLLRMFSHDLQRIFKSEDLFSGSKTKQRNALILSVHELRVSVNEMYFFSLRNAEVVLKIPNELIFGVSEFEITENLDGILLKSISFPGTQERVNISLHQIQNIMNYNMSWCLCNLNLKYDKNKGLKWIQGVKDIFSFSDTATSPGRSLGITLDFRDCSMQICEDMIILGNGRLFASGTETMIDVNSMNVGIFNCAPIDNLCLISSSIQEFYEFQGFAFVGQVENSKVVIDHDSIGVVIEKIAFEFESRLYAHFVDQLKLMISSPEDPDINISPREHSIEKWTFEECYYKSSVERKSPSDLPSENQHDYRSVSSEDDRYSFVNDFADLNERPIMGDFKVTYLSDEGFQLPKTEETPVVEKSIEVKVAEFIVKLTGDRSPSDLHQPFVELSLDYSDENASTISMKEELPDYIEIELSTSGSETSTILPEDSVSAVNEKTDAKIPKAADTSTTVNDSVRLKASGLLLNHVKFLPNNNDLSSELNFKVRECEIVDDLRASYWNKLMTRRKQENITDKFQQTMSDFIEVSIATFMNDGQAEHELKANVVPLRLHVDQDTLMFLVNYFAFERNDVESKDKTFFRKAQVNPFTVRVDYKPKHFDLEQVSSVELMDFLHLNSVNIEFPPIHVTGISSISNLSQTIQLRYLDEVTRKQLPRILAGLSPVRPIVNIGTGIKDFIMIPLQQAKQQGNIWGGVKKGTSTLAKKAVRQTTDISINLTIGAQKIFESIDRVISPTSSSIGNSTLHNRQSKFSDSPENVQEGLRKAYQTLYKSLEETKSMVAVPIPSSSKSEKLLRAVPVAIVHPLVGISNALRLALLGAKASLDPQAHQHMKEKYKSTKDSKNNR